MSDSAGGGAFTLFLAAGMLFTGTINTITTKFQDLQVVKGFGDAPPTPFEHAFFQTGCMFIGEFLCLFVYRFSILPIFQSKKQEESSEEPSGDSSINTTEAAPKTYVNPLLFWIPACCDLGGTTLLNVGLFLTYASVAQMLRGSLIIFTGILSVVFLKHRLYPHHWGGIIVIVIGTLMVATSSILNSSSDGPTAGARNPTLGAILIVAAQVLAAVQFVVEEKLLKNVDAAPLQVVGWEGFFGLSMTTVFLFVLYWIPGKDNHSWESAPFALAQMWNSNALAAGVIGSIISIAFFNFFGISITKRVSATIRAIIDSTRTFCIWICSLYLEWETFNWLQFGGFIVLVFGSLVANEVLKIPVYHGWYVAHKAAYEAAKAAKAAQKAEDVTEKQSLLNNKEEAN